MDLLAVVPSTDGGKVRIGRYSHSETVADEARDYVVLALQDLDLANDDVDVLLSLDQARAVAHALMLAVAESGAAEL